MKPTFKPKKILFCFFICSISQTFGQSNNFNPQLKIQLDSIAYTDQNLRLEITDILAQLNKLSLLDSADIQLRNVYMDRIQTLFSQQEIIDSVNLNCIENIILLHGYPGKSIVGIPTNEVAWYVIQHSDKIETYLPLIKKAGKKNEIPRYLVGLMIDRERMQKGKKQIYGSQGYSFPDKDGNITSFIWPIRNPKNVNKRRLKLGFDSSVEDNAKEKLNIEYEVVKLRYVKELKN